jgi:chromosomal replication initiation ATPase DnaA
MNKPKASESVTIISPYVFVGIRPKYLPADLRLRLKRLKHRYSVDIISDAIEMVTKVPMEKLSARNRRRNVSEARTLYCYFVKQKMNLSLSQIGFTISKHHTTIIHNIKLFKDLYQVNEEFKKMADDVSELIEINSLDNL